MSGRMWCDGRSGLLAIAAFALLVAGVVSADPVDAKTAKTMAQGWLACTGHLDQALLDRKVKSVKAVKDGQKLLYYAVSLSPEGYILASPDNEIEPVIGFSATGKFNRKTIPTTKIADQISRVQAGVLKKVKAQRSALKGAPANGTMVKPTEVVTADANTAKWNKLIQKSKTKDSGDHVFNASTNFESRLNMYVEPMLKSTWGAGNVNGEACFNYYTPTFWHEPDDAYPKNLNTLNHNTNAVPPISPPPNAGTFPDLHCTEYKEGQASNCGTAPLVPVISQILRYHAYQRNDGMAPYNEDPQIGWRSVVSADFHRDPPPDGNLHGFEQWFKFMGGDGVGGKYDFTKMPLKPGATLTVDERKMIGKFCFDICLTIHPSFSMGLSGGSCADGYDGRPGPKPSASIAYPTFGYAARGAASWADVRAGLDAGCPSHGYAGDPPSEDPNFMHTWPAHHFVVHGYGKFLEGNSWYYKCDNEWYTLELGSMRNFMFELNHDGGSLVAIIFSNIWPDIAKNMVTDGVSATGGPGLHAATDNVISGRVYDISGAPLQGATVTLKDAGGVVLTTTTTSPYGVYAFIKPNAAYQLTVAKGSFIFYNVASGTATGSATLAGVNSWGNDFKQKTSPVISTAEVVTITGSSVTILAKVIDNGGEAIVETNPPVNYGAYCDLTANPTKNADGLTCVVTPSPDSSKFYVNFTGLIKGNTYHIRAFAKNPTFGISYGGDCLFLSE